MTDVQDTLVAPTCLVEKRCTRCGETKSVAFFSKATRTKDGLKEWCKPCAAVYYAENRERYKKRWANYYAENHQKMLDRAHEYNKSNKDKISAYYFANRERINERATAYRNANKEKIAARQSAYQKAHPEKYTARYHNRRARKLGNGGTYAAADVYQLLTLQKSKCACCRKSIKHGYHVDHIVPIAIGGTNDKTNLQLLCPPCNLSKGAKDPIIFMQKRGKLL